MIHILRTVLAIVIAICAYVISPILLGIAQVMYFTTFFRFFRTDHQWKWWPDPIVWRVRNPSDAERGEPAPDGYALFWSYDSFWNMVTDRWTRSVAHEQDFSSDW